jgi:hypothetical protein
MTADLMDNKPSSSVVRSVVPQARQQLLEDRRDRFINGLLVRVHHDLRASLLPDRAFHNRPREHALPC